ncbi:MAG: dihydrodipicolinate reductase [Thermoanaerobaculia bacterium]
MKHVQPISVAIYGLGPIGAEIAKLMLRKPWLKVVAAVDIDPNKVGKDLGEVIGTGQKTGIIVTKELETRCDAVCHSTLSRLTQVEQQLLTLLNKGCHVVSTCEELSFPLDPTIRENLQHAARAANVTLLGTGVNPGFVMDKLPLTITSVCQEVREVNVFRVVDASLRREPLQRKVGAGISREEFQKRVEAGTLKHMGLKESLMMIADGMNVHLEEVSEEKIMPMIADHEITTQYFKVAPGEVAGVHQTISGKGKIDISLDIKMYVGATDPADRVEVKGIPDVSMVITGGVHGDRATAAMAVNSIPRVVVARPGLLTMDDIPISYR